MSKELICVIGIFMGFIILILAACGKKFLDLEGEAVGALGFVGFIIMVGSLIGACNGH